MRFAPSMTSTNVSISRSLPFVNSFWRESFVDGYLSCRLHIAHRRSAVSHPQNQTWSAQNAFHFGF